MPRYGKTLESLLQVSNFQISKESLYRLGIRLIDALEQVHSAGFIYNDLKPDNIMFLYGQRFPADLSQGDWLKKAPISLIDFGFATRYLN
jgi:serine/threonine protein kinase